MRVFITGASGWIGSAVIPELLSAGHTVVGLARSEASAARVAALGAEPRRGDLTDLDALRRGAEDADGAVHLAFDHDFSRFGASLEEDARAVAAMGAALAGTGRPLVVTSGTPAVPGRPATEEDGASAAGLAPGLAAGRIENGAAALGLAAQGVRVSVVRLPRSVHGEGERHGFVPMLVARARQEGVSGYVGDGASRWPAVHVRDAARLYRLALEGAPAGATLHAVGDEGIATREIAERVGRHLGVPTASVPAEGFGFLGGVLALDQPASSALTQGFMDWRPIEPGLLADLDAGHYFA